MIEFAYVLEPIPRVIVKFQLEIVKFGEES